MIKIAGKPGKLILASASPRRRVLFEEAGLKFDVFPADVEEFEDPDAEPSAVVHHNAILKARAIASIYPQDLVIGSDTMVFSKQQVLGKPADLDEARRMLMTLSGSVHTVYSSIAMVWTDGGLEEVHVTKSDVTFKDLDAKVIDEYFALVDPLDKAGAYGIQKGRDLIIKKVDGSVANVMGFPIEFFIKRITELDWLDIFKTSKA